MYNNRALRGHALVKAPTPFVCASLCSALLHLLLFSPAVTKMTVTDEA